MKVNDSCKCGATFSARGRSKAVAKLWAAWINVHDHCRGSNMKVTVKEPD